MIFLDRRVLSIDLETYNDVDLVNCGVYRYVEGDFHILLFAYAFDDEADKYAQTVRSKVTAKPLRSHGVDL